MKLNELLKQSEIETSNRVDSCININGITDSSLLVEENFVFVAVKGFEKDGHQFIQQAIGKGAAVIVGEEDIKDLPVPYLKVNNSRKAVGQLSSAFYGFPSKKKLVIGVTGTNGKTTTSLFLTHLLRKMGYSVSFFGTVFNEINGSRTASSLTTPNASVLQKELAESRDEAVVIEVSSEGLDQYRMEGMFFDYAVFTNLQKDHLDYHKTMEGYFKAKQRLFDLLKPNGKAVINVDDRWGERLSGILKNQGKTVLSLGSNPEETFQLTRVEDSESQCIVDQKEFFLQPPIPGKYNSLNLLMAGLIVHDLGVSLEKVQKFIQDAEIIPGRFEQYKISDYVDIIVDYAHTAEALSAVLETVKKIYPKRKIVHLFGFRGNRYVSKREAMIEASSAYSNEIILTTDDLNTSTVEEMETEYRKYENDKISVVMDRSLALEQAVEQSVEPTVVIVTGKGHEKYTTPTALNTSSDRETVFFIQKKRTPNEILE